MTEDEIPNFIQDVIDAGCEPIAVGDDAWLIGDADLPEEVALAIHPTLKEIDRRYGDRDHLHFAIIEHLRAIGRVFRIEDQPPEIQKLFGDAEANDKLH